MYMSPGNCPNKDEIHISHSRNIQIEHSIIRTGDDCIAIISATMESALRAYQDPITGIHIKNCTFTNSVNGLQIKSWANSPNYPALAADISFQDVVMHSTGNPIFLNQHYCPGQGCDPKVCRRLYTKIC